ncbi:MAG: mechanosensitive ion channel family protein [Endozoicomonas sp.]
MELTGIYGVSLPHWLAEVLVALLLTAIFSFVVGKVFDRLSAGAIKTKTLWDDALVGSGRKPLKLTIWVLGLGWVADIIWQSTGNPLFARLSSFRDVLVIALISWAMIRFIKAIERGYLARHDESEKKIDPTTLVAGGRLLRIIVIITGCLVVLQTLGYSLSGVLAFGGVGGIAVGFAAKDMLANLFGGLMIYLDKPFRVGDWICSPDRQIEGTVQYIGWRQTRILTFAKRPLYVPNATFMNISVENPSRMENRRIKETVGLRYADSSKVSSVLAEIRQYLQSNEAIAQDKIIMVNFTCFGPSSLDCFIYCFTRTTDWATFHAVKEQVLLDIVGIIHRHGADIAFPTRTLDFPVDQELLLVGGHKAEAIDTAEAVKA